MTIITKIKNIGSKIKCEEAILFLTLMFIGGFHEFISLAVSVVLSVFLIIKILKNNLFCIHINIVSISIMAIGIGYFISIFYAIDFGMAFLGFLKFLPVILYLLLLMQRKDKREEIINKLPYMALLLGTLSAIGMIVPVLQNYFVVSDRLAGFFQYPNTFALFLLISELVLLSKKQYKPLDFVIMVWLIVLLLFTGSRTVFVIAVLSNAFMIFCKKGRKIKIAVIGIFFLLFVLIFAFSPVLKNVSFLERFFALTLNESTFVGRLLYYYDALPVLLKNPFGLGYMGYYYIQQSIQTGVYSVKYIHNDLLQIMLDVGWIPCILFFAGIVKSLFSKESRAKKIILITIVLHGLFDFDLQFTAMFFILILFLDFESGKNVTITKNKVVILFSMAIVGIFSFYFSIALGFSYFGNIKASDVMYPFYTENKILMLINLEDAKSQATLADDILLQNEFVQIAYSAKARYAYVQGDFGTLIKTKHKIFEIAPFSYDEYKEYSYMLIQGIYLYQNNKDNNSINICKQELIDTKNRLQSNKEKLSELGKKIKDQPQTELPDDVVEYISHL